MEFTAFSHGCVEDSNISNYKDTFIGMYIVDSYQGKRCEMNRTLNVVDQNLHDVIVYDKCCIIYAT